MVHTARPRIGSSGAWIGTTSEHMIAVQRICCAPGRESTIVISLLGAH